MLQGVVSICQYDPPIVVDLLLQCGKAQGSRLQPKRVAHERSEGVLPFKVAAGDQEPSPFCKKQAQNSWGSIPRQMVTPPVCMLQIWCYMKFYGWQLLTHTHIHSAKMDSRPKLSCLDLNWVKIGPKMTYNSLTLIMKH